MGVVSMRWMWVESMGVVVRKCIDFNPHITYPYSSCICSFLQQHPYFLFIFYFIVFILYNYIIYHKVQIKRLTNLADTYI